MKEIPSLAFPEKDADFDPGDPNSISGRQNGMKFELHTADCLRAGAAVWLRRQRVYPEPRLFDIDADAAELPLAVGGDEAELILHLLGRRVEMAFKTQHALVVDLRIFIRNHGAGDDRVEHGVLLDQVLEDGPQLVGWKLLAERL